MIRKNLVSLCLLLLATPACRGKTENLDAFLREGRTGAGLAAFAAPTDNAGFFSLAVLRTLDGLQHFSARDEFRPMFSCSRLCWQRVLAETDNDKEWLPSPKQTGPRGFKVTQAQVDAWMRVLDELEAVASGKKLLAHWRLKPGVGINVDKLIASPPPLDLVLLLQGSALVPYVEEGVVSDLAAWRRLTEPLGPGFPQFAIFSN